MTTNLCFDTQSVVAYITSLNSTPPFRRFFRLKNHGKRTLENPQSIDITGFVRVVAIIPYGHAFATMCFEMGVTPKDAQQLLGHSKIEVTMDTYTHIRKNRREDVAAKLNKAE